MKIIVDCYKITITFLLEKKLVLQDNILEKDLKQTIIDRVQSGIEIPIERIRLTVKN